mmetsp:Transcript_33212/g.32632  ORF Transcript_33212/g.32632 Transcript_33212/m.32632 type:complete len:287 (+) Transcript_33212:198-1058(+)
MLLVGVCPGGLLGSLVVEHVGHGDKAIGLLAINVHAEDSGRNHHSDFGELIQSELAVFRHHRADQVVVCFDVFDFLENLSQEWRPFEVSSFFFCEEDWEVLKCFRQNVDEGVERRFFSFQAFLQNVSGQEPMLRRQQLRLHIVVHHLGSDGTFFSHFKCDDLLFGDQKNFFTCPDFLGGMDPSVNWVVEPDLKFFVLASTFFEPGFKAVEPLLVRVAFFNCVIVVPLLLTLFVQFSGMLVVRINFDCFLRRGQRLFSKQEFSLSLGLSDVGLGEVIFDFNTLGSVF